jgi:hypothetical protein
MEEYRRQSRWSDPGRFHEHVLAVPPDPAVVARSVAGLILHVFVAEECGVPVPANASGDREVRSAEEMLGRLLGRDARALIEPRAPGDRLFAICRHYAVLAAAIFRAHGIPARARVGFAGYFTPGFWEDHWVCEYHDGRGWRRLDAELDDALVATLGIGFPVWDVPRDRFLDAPAAWLRLRAGEIDPLQVGLSKLDLRGAWFAAGNVMRDSAALVGDELLPWDCWSAALEIGQAPEVPCDWAARFDAVARVLCDGPDAAVVQHVLEEHPWLRVPQRIVSFTAEGPRDVDLGGEATCA